MFGDIVGKNEIDLSWVKIVPNPVKFGYEAERAIEQWLRHVLDATRFSVVWVGTGGGCDIRIINRITGENTRVEVKASRQGQDNKYRATLYKQAHTDAARHSDIVIFVCLPNGSTVASLFIIPTHKVAHKTFLCVTSHPKTYQGKYAKFRSAVQYLPA